MIGIINYGLGNIRAYYNIYKDNGIDLKIISNHKEIDSKIKKLILPGIGYFDKAIELLEKKNFFEEIKNFSINNSNKIVGICVGMKIVTNGSVFIQKGIYDSTITQLKYPDFL